MTARELRDAVASRQRSAVEISRACLERIAERDGDLHAFLTVTAERAMARAADVDRGVISGPLAGVPVALKDNLCTRGVRTTAGSRLLDAYAPPYDATVVD